MHPDFLTILRCPFDPLREATLIQVRDQLQCSSCGTCFPIKNGLPVLLTDEAELPPDVPVTAKLPCQQKPRRS